MNKQTFDCYFCGGEVTVQQVNVMRHWKDRYILIENVPAHVCTQCGERYYDAVTAEAMDQIMRASETELGVKHEIRVPVVEMPIVYPLPQYAGAAVRDE
jgi:YgiT-type zinc finger domain-containing protein